MSPRPSWRDRYQRGSVGRSRLVHPKIYGTTPRERPTFRLSIGIKVWAISAAVFATLCVAWFLFLSPAFAIQRIDVVGTVTPDVLSEIQQLQGKNLLAYSSGNMDEKLRGAQSSIRTLEISKGLPNTLRIELVLRTPVLRWKSGDETYFIDANGEAFQRGEGYVSPTDDRPVPEIVDTYAQPVVSGRPIIRKELVAFVETLDREFPSKFPVGVRNYEIGESTLQLALVTEPGWKILLDTTRPVDAQLEATKQVFERFHDQIREYVDLRVEGRAYFK